MTLYDKYIQDYTYKILSESA